MLIATSLLIVVLLIVIYVIYRHYENRFAALKRRGHEVGANAVAETQELSKGIVGHVETTIGKVREASNDPVVEDLQKDISERANTFLKIVSDVLDNYYILFGISSGLMAMSLVSVFFNFTDHVISPLEHRVAVFSYAAFFSAFTFGIAKNGFVKRKIQRLKDQNENLQSQHAQELEKLQATFDELIQGKLAEHDQELTKYKELLADLTAQDRSNQNSKNIKRGVSLFRKLRSSKNE
jgi:hypothetical protein